MNQEITEIDGKKYVDTDEGTFEITGDNIEETLELENYLEYLNDRIDFFKERLSKRDYSKLSLKEIRREEIKKKNLPLFDRILNRLIAIVFAFAVFVLAFVPIFYLSAFLCGIIILFIPRIYELFKGYEKKKNDIDFKEIVRKCEEIYFEKEKELSKIKNYTKRECPSIDQQELETFSNYCPFSPTIVLDEQKPLSRKRLL